jgi:protocatechuate 3,4-dioxygenase beta subunit
MKNLKQILILSLIGLVNSVNAQAAYGEIRGKITNTDGKTVPFATIKIVQADLLVGGTQSDENGNYVYKPLTPGSYVM